LGVVDGNRITGSQAVRTMSTTQGALSSHNLAAFANYLNTSPQFTGERGGLLRRAGLPENFIVPNPQYGFAGLTSNFASSTYNSLQVEVIRRFSSGWTFQGNYNWSRTLGEDDGNNQGQYARYRDLRNWRLDKRLLGSHRTQVARANGTWELPFGPRKRWAGGTRGLAARLLERWQLGGILSISTGPPIDVLVGGTSANNTAMAVAPFSKATGAVRRTGEGVVYFEGLQQVPDPSIAGLTTLGGVRGAAY
jgi:hypothetical protein